MKVKCPISGTTYSTENFLRGHTVHPHPIFSESVTVAQLGKWYLADWQDGKLSSIETHLFGLALVCKLPVASLGMAELNELQVESLQKLWNANIEKLYFCAEKLDSRKWKLKGIPNISVTLENLRNLPEWIKDIKLAIETYSAPISDKARELNRSQYKVSDNQLGRNAAAMLDSDEVESLVTRALRGSLLSASEQKALPVILADWANKVTEFPGHIKLRWQKVIQMIFAQDFINQILMSDISPEQVKAIEEHIVLNTPADAVGTSHSTLILRRLHEVIPVLEDFNPVVSTRRKVDEDSLTAALFGADEVKPAKPVAKPATGVKPMSLQEKLAARLGRKPTEFN